MIGPHPKPWPTDEHFDPELLAHGDGRNVVDRYRYWKLEAIVADLDKHRHSLHIAIENLQHDFNIGSIIRTANAFLVAEIHIVGKRRWNRRGAMVTDRYQHIRYHDTPAALAVWCADRGLAMIGIDHAPDAQALEHYEFPKECLLFFGQEGSGLSTEAREYCQVTLEIAQFGSTRSINVGAAAAIAMHAWVTQHARID